MSRDEAFHEEELNTFTIKIYSDADPTSPREWDNLGTLIGFRGDRYSFWEETRDFELFLRSVGVLPAEDAEYEQNEDGDGEDTETPTLEESLYMEKLKSECIWIPVEYHDYGSGGGRFREDSDEEPMGAIYADLRDIKKWLGDEITKITPEIKERVTNILKGEIETLDNWTSGEVYGFVIENSAGDEEDSCWGFFGDYKYCLEEAKSIVKTYDYQLALPGLEKEGD